MKHSEISNNMVHSLKNSPVTAPLTGYTNCFLLICLIIVLSWNLLCLLKYQLHGSMFNVTISARKNALTGTLV